MVLKTLERTGSLHGYGIARQIEQTSADLFVSQLRHSLSGSSEAGAGRVHQFGMGSFRQQSEGQVLSINACGPQADRKETQEWEQMTAILARFLSPEGSGMKPSYRVGPHSTSWE